MNKPELFNKNNQAAKSIAGQIIKRYFSRVQWRTEGYRTLMDVASGPGCTFNQYIYPLVADKFQKFICSDIAEEMLAYSEKTYGTANKFEYRLFDISTPLGAPQDLRGTIDHLTAIYALHMVQDLSQAVKNLYDCLRPDGGESLMVFMPTNSAFETYDCLSKSPKWHDYREIIKQGVPPLFYSQDPMADFENLLRTVGFSQISTERIKETCAYDNWEDFRDGMQSVCVVLKFLPTPELQEEFLNDYLNNIVSLTRKSETDTKFYLHIDIIAASVKKIDVTVARVFK